MNAAEIAALTAAAQRYDGRVTRPLVVLVSLIQAGYATGGRRCTITAEGRESVAQLGEESP